MRLLSLWTVVGLVACVENPAPGKSPAPRTEAGDSGASEACEATVISFADRDGDGFGDPTLREESCSMPAGHVSDATDCDDTNAEVHPSAVEVCNELDDDCDGLLDDLDPDVTGLERRFEDADGDGVGTGRATAQCPGPGNAEVDGDCADDDPSVAPGLPEVCDDNVDQDCDSLVDCADMDCDGACPEDCSDGRDNDGDGLLDCEDADCGSEVPCVETAAVCDDGRDNDHDGTVDCADDDCWQLGGCVRSTAHLTDAAGLTHHTRWHTYDGFFPGSHVQSSSVDTRLEVEGLAGQVTIETLAGSTVCGFSMAAGYLQRATGVRRGRPFSSSTGQTTWELSSACPSPWTTALVPVLYRDFASSQSGRVLRASMAGQRAAWLTGTDWQKSFSRERTSSFYSGTDGHGSPTSYGWVSSISLLRSDARELTVSPDELVFVGPR